MQSFFNFKTSFVNLQYKDCSAIYFDSKCDANLLTDCHQGDSAFGNRSRSQADARQYQSSQGEVGVSLGESFTYDDFDYTTRRDKPL